MTKRVLIIGGYGNFGSYIARSLAPDANIQLLIGGRSLERAQAFIATLTNAAAPPEAVMLDITASLVPVLEEAKPDIVIHTTGPFQFQGYHVVEACLHYGCHYIDLADARNYVTGIERFDAVAKEENLLVVSGASSVSCLTAAVIDYYYGRFKSLEKIEYGISAAQEANCGLATTSSVLSSIGEPFFTLVDGQRKKIYGWQGLHAHKYPELGWRLLGNCDIPDLEMFPVRYPQLKTIIFSAGHEIPFLHVGLWLLSWPVRAGLLPPVEHMTSHLMKASPMFDRFGTKRSGFHMLLSGYGKNGEYRTEKFYLIARSGHGLQISCVPAIVLAKGLAKGTIKATGARPCLDLIDLDTYFTGLEGLDISIVMDEEVSRQKPEPKPKPWEKIGAQLQEKIKAKAQAAKKPPSKPQSKS